MGDHVEDGGSAFPREAYVNPNGVVIRTGSDGMTLRDYFAGQVIASVRGWHPADRQGRSAAEIAYQIADAMLEARRV